MSNVLLVLTIKANSPPVQLQLAPIRCWKCHQPMKATRGYIFEPSEVPGSKAFIALKLVSDTRQLTALIADLRKTDASIAPVGFNYSKMVKGQYFSASCPHCSAICCDFHMSGMHFWESVLALCQFPECECCYTADTDCEGCEYHDLNLRLSEDQTFEVSEQVGAFRAGHYPEDY